MLPRWPCPSVRSIEFSVDPELEIGVWGCGSLGSAPEAFSGLALQPIRAEAGAALAALVFGFALALAEPEQAQRGERFAARTIEEVRIRLASRHEGSLQRARGTL
jgi:hypothetical protein